MPRRDVRRRNRQFEFVQHDRLERAVHSDPHPPALTDASKQAVNAALDDLRTRLAGPFTDPVQVAAERLQASVDALVEAVRAVEATARGLAAAKDGTS